MKISAWFVALLAAFQNLLMMIGFFPVQTKEIDYGGTPYQEAVIVEPMSIIKDGVSDYRIVLSDDASMSEVAAAEELQH